VPSSDNTQELANICW